MINLLIGTLYLIALGLNFMVIARALSPTATVNKRVNTGAIIIAVGIVVIAVGVLVSTGMYPFGFEPHPQGGTAIASLGFSVLVIGATEIFRVLGKAETMCKGACITAGIGAILFVIVLCLSLFGIIPSLF